MFVYKVYIYILLNLECISLISSIVTGFIQLIKKKKKDSIRSDVMEKKEIRIRSEINQLMNTSQQYFIFIYNNHITTIIIIISNIDIVQTINNNDTYNKSMVI